MFVCVCVCVCVCVGGILGRGTDSPERIFLFFVQGEKFGGGANDTLPLPTIESGGHGSCASSLRPLSVNLFERIRMGRVVEDIHMVDRPDTYTCKWIQSHQGDHRSARTKRSINAVFNLIIGTEFSF